MFSIRPTRSQAARPSIKELANFLLSPKQSPQTSCRGQRTYNHLVNTYRAPSKRPFSSSSLLTASSKPKSHDRGPASTEDTQTDFSFLDVLGNTPPPSTSIDACLWDGFHLNNGMKITDGDGVLLVGGEAFTWRPWEANGDNNGVGEVKKLVNEKGQWDVGSDAWGLFDLVWPKPDLLILGLGKDMKPISPRTRQYLNSLGISIDIQDTRNAAAQFNLLATERGVGSVAAALIPIGFKDCSRISGGE